MEKINKSLKGLFSSTRPPNDDEYVHENGLYYCKKCKTPRQVRFEDDVSVIFPTKCDCQAAIAKAEEDARKAAERAEYIRQLRHSGIANPAYRSYTFEADDGKTPDITEICKNFVRQFDSVSKMGGGLLLYGSVGTGKSYFAMCIANALIDKGVAVYATSLATVVKMAQDFDSADRHFDSLMRKKLIVVDDLGTERGTTFACEQIYKFIDGCNTHNIPLVFTTNYTPSMLAAAAEDTSDLTYARIYSRILEKCLPVKVNEVKRRLENGQANKQTLKKLLKIGEQ